MSDIADLLQRLTQTPHDEELLKEAGASLREDPVRFAQAAQALLPVQLEDAAAVPHQGSWSNCIGNQVCRPAAIQRPTSLNELVDAVRQAASHGQTVRAVGSGHSYSDVAITEGLLLDPHGMSKPLPIDSSVLKDPSAVDSLFSVESGITLRELNRVLGDKGRALINMGAYDAQTLAGALSTSTHGTGAGLGPLPSFVRSLLLVSEDGTVYQIEPTDGITDRAKFEARYPHIVLKQDDDWFHSNVVAMGCMGLIYAYTLKVTDSYFLCENRTATTWEALKPQLLNHEPGQLPSIITTPRHFEIDVNPYAVDGAHKCIVTTRDICPGPASGSRGISNWLAGVLARLPFVQKMLVAVLNHIPTLTPYVIDSGLDTLKDSNYIAKSYEVLDLGAVNEASAYAVELSFEAASFVESIDRLLELFATYAQSHDYYQTGPIGIRFVASAQALLAPQYGRETCMAELDMLNGTHNGKTLLDSIQKVMCAEQGVRVHWGLELDTLRGEQLPLMYPEFARWKSVYQQLNSKGMFNNSFTQRMNLSLPIPAEQTARQSA